MKFEDALTALRKGAKIRHPYMPHDEYYMACITRICAEFLEKPGKSVVGCLDFPGFPFIHVFYDDGWEIQDKININIVWMKAEKEHPDFMPRNFNPNVCKHGHYPMMNLLWVMSAEWEIVEDVK